MGIFSKFRENAVDQKENGDGKNDVDHNVGDPSSSKTDMASTSPEKGIIESVGEILQTSANNVKEVVFGSASDGDIESLPCTLAMEDPFSQSDNVLAAVVERDLRSSSFGLEDDAQGKTIVQTVRENLAYSAHIVRDTVLGHSHVAESNGNRFAQAASPVEEENSNGGTDEHRRTIIETMGEMMSHPVLTVKEIIGSHNNVAESSPVDQSLSSQEKEIFHDGDDRKKTVVENVSEILTQSGETVKEAVLRHTSVDRVDMYDVRSVTSKQEPSSINDSERPEEPVENGEVKGLMQSVKDAAYEVKEEVMEAVQEVKDAVMSSETLPNVPESITEDAGERPSMELVHTIVHD